MAHVAKPDCIFCKIVAGQAPARFVYQGEEVVAFHNIKPAAPIHVVIIPKKHVATVADLNDADRAAAAEMLLAVRCIAERTGVKDSGFKLVVNKGGPHVEMLVSHLHMHLIGGKQLKGEI